MDKDFFKYNINASYIDLNLTQKNLNKFLNNDLIRVRVFYNNLVVPVKNTEIIDSYNSCSISAYISGNSEFISNFDSPELNINIIYLLYE